jgi:ElaB/YqjD/DUF883 family membrane-anchored ribosome-binding protein
MKPAILEKTSEYLDESAQVAAKAASVFVDGAKAAFVDGAKAAKGAAVRGYEAAEDAVTATGRQIRRKPLAAVLGAVGAGIVIGLLIGRKTKG